MISRMPHPEHPLVPPDRPDRAPDLVRQGLEGQLVIALCKCGGERIVGPLFCNRQVKDIDRFCKPASQEMLVPLKRNAPREVPRKLGRKVKPVRSRQYLRTGVTLSSPEKTLLHPTILPVWWMMPCRELLM